MYHPCLQNNSKAETLTISRVYWDTYLNYATKFDHESQGLACYRCDYESEWIHDGSSGFFGATQMMRLKCDHA